MKRLCTQTVISERLLANVDLISRAKEMARKSLERMGCHDITVSEPHLDSFGDDEIGYMDQWVITALGWQSEGALRLLQQLGKLEEQFSNLCARYGEVEKQLSDLLKVKV